MAEQQHILNDELEIAYLAEFSKHNYELSKRLRTFPSALPKPWIRNKREIGRDDRTIKVSSFLSNKTLWTEDSLKQFYKDILRNKSASFDNWKNRDEITDFLTTAPPEKHKFLARNLLNSRHANDNSNGAIPTALLDSLLEKIEAVYEPIAEIETISQDTNVERSAFGEQDHSSGDFWHSFVHNTGLNNRESESDRLIQNLDIICVYGGRWMIFNF